jgi:triosephosphate isomerase
MAMAKRLIVANWKMNPATPREAKALFAAGSRVVARLSGRRVEAVICPPALYLPLLAPRVEKAGAALALGAQDAFWEEEGAHTGLVSALMLRRAGAEYLIVGHSERRAAGDTDQIVNRKLKAALAAGLKVILCVGESERDQAGAYLGWLRQQVVTALAGVPPRFLNKIIVAYEPVWAIGEGASRADTPSGFLEQALYIRKIVSGLPGVAKEAALALPVIYGGSVTPENAASFLTAGAASGLLVGRSSLDPVAWRAILHAAETAL